MTTSTMLRGDALAILPLGSVDTVIADPPYNSGGRTASERPAAVADREVRLG